MNVMHPHAFGAPERLSALRLEIATRRKARQVNLGVVCRQHHDRLRDAARRCDQSARAAIGRLLDVVASDADWSPTVGRALRAAARGLSAVAARLSHAPATADEIAWLRDRLAEIAAQDARVTALEAVFAATGSEAERKGPARRSKATRPR